jgi:YidC/Oxa1 family membrane protein insertase
MDNRTILAFVLMAAILVVYQIFFMPVSEGPPEPVPEAIRPAPDPGAPPAVHAPPGTAWTEGLPPIRSVTTPPQRTLPIDTPLYRGVISTNGGKLLQWTLHYRGEKPMVVAEELGPRGLVVGTGVGGALDVLPMHTAERQVMLGPEQPRGTLTLTGEEDELTVQQVLEFVKNDYTVHARIQIVNTGERSRTVTVALPWTARLPERNGKGDEGFVGQRPTEVVWSANGRLQRIEDLAAVGSHTAEAGWIAMGSTWYLAALMPQTPGFAVVAEGGRDPGGADGAAVTIAARAMPTIAPGETWDGHVMMYVGPKEYDRLDAHGLAGTINFGGFPVPRSWGGLPMEWIGVPILRLMKWVYGWVGNYGIAIIILTVITKVLFYPLTVKSLRSMKAMQALTPQVNALRSKHKNDPQALQRETLDLYRTNKVNPMGGCLPMIAQIPIFYALYLALSVSVELQNAPFLCFGRVFGTDLWICDLASHDPTYVLPVLMGISMFVQQKMTPVMGDPRQAKIMLVMPFVFTFMFLSLPSGLVLYWFVSNLIQILQQWYMDWPRAGGGEPAKTPKAPRAAKGKAKEVRA